MSQIPFSADWLKQFSDPYAVLGISVTADDRRILKRYRSVAKLLHPDAHATSPDTRDLASQLFARLVNPAYQKIKQDKGRAETLAMLRFRVRRIKREETLTPRGAAAQQLLTTSPAAVDTVYEQAIAELAEKQFQPLSQFEQVTVQMEELNLVYLRLKMGEPMLREKRTGIVAANEAKPLEFVPAAPVAEKPVVNYAQRHCVRAQEYMKKQNWAMAVQELRDALRIEPNKSDYHAMLAQAYLMQNLVGMAKVHFRQALRYNPHHKVALEYAKRLKIKLDPPLHSNQAKGGLFGLFARRP